MDAATGAGTGAATGAAIGSAVPGIGTAIGGVAGGALGLIGGLLSESSARAAKRKAINKAVNELKKTEGFSGQMLEGGQGYLEQLLATAQGLYGDNASAGSALRQAQAGVDSLDPYSASEFSYGKDISDFYDPAYQLSVNTANDAVNSSQALGGNLFSSDTANKLAAQNQILASNMYKDALSAYQTDKSLEQAIWSGDESAKQAAANSAANLAQQKYNMAADTASNLNNANNSYYQGLLSLDNDYYKNMTDYYGQIASLMAQAY